MRRSFSNRAMDFMGRSALGGENGFVRDKRLMAAAGALAVIFLVSQSAVVFVALMALILGVLIADVRRYNREHAGD